MQLDSVFIRASAPSDLRRLRALGGEIWQEHGQIHDGGITWHFAVVKVPAARALRAHLFALDEIGETADDAPLSVVYPPTDTPAPKRRKRTTTPAALTPFPAATTTTTPGVANVHPQAPSHTRNTHRSAASVSAISARPRRRIPRSGGDHAA